MIPSIPSREKKADGLRNTQYYQSDAGSTQRRPSQSKQRSRQMTEHAHRPSIQGRCGCSCVTFCCAVAVAVECSRPAPALPQQHRTATARNSTHVVSSHFLFPSGLLVPSWGWAYRSPLTSNINKRGTGPLFPSSVTAGMGPFFRLPSASRCPVCPCHAMVRSMGVGGGSPLPTLRLASPLSTCSLDRSRHDATRLP